MCWRRLKWEGVAHSPAHWLGHPLRNPMGQERLRWPAQWMVAASCRRPGFYGPACVWTPHGFYLQGFPSLCGSCWREARVLQLTAFRGSTPDFSLRLSPEVFSAKGYFRKTAGFEISFPSPRWAAKGYRASPARLPVIPLATLSHHVVLAYDQVVWPHRSYSPSGGFPRGKPRTRHMWICLQLSGGRGMDNGGVRFT